MSKESRQSIIRAWAPDDLSDKDLRAHSTAVHPESVEEIDSLTTPNRRESVGLYIGGWLDRHVFTEAGLNFMRNLCKTSVCMPIPLEQYDQAQNAQPKNQNPPPVSE